MRTIEQLQKFFGEDVPFSTYLYNINTGAVALCNPTVLVLKKNVPDLEEDTIYLFNRIKCEDLTIKDSELHVIFKKDALLLLRYNDLLLLCMADAADMVKALMNRLEREREQEYYQAAVANAE